MIDRPRDLIWQCRCVRFGVSVGDHHRHIVLKASIRGVFCILLSCFGAPVDSGGVRISKFEPCLKHVHEGHLMLVQTSKYRCLVIWSLEK